MKMSQVWKYQLTYSLIASCLGCTQAKQPLDHKLSTLSKVGGDSSVDDNPWDSIRLESPLTPLTKAIQTKALDALLRRQNLLKQNESDVFKPLHYSDQNSLPDAVKEAILETLANQNVTPEMVASERRPCRIDPRLIKPYEIIYALQRAALGRPGDPWSATGAGSLPLIAKNTSWQKILGYNTDQVDLNRGVERWFKELESKGLNTLSLAVKSSLGLKTFVVDPIFAGTPGMPRFSQHPFSLRCFFASQLDTLYIGINRQEVLEKLFAQDPFEYTKSISLAINDLGSHTATVPGLLEQLLSSKPTITHLQVEQYVSDIKIMTSWLGGCELSVPVLAELSEGVRARIKRFSFEANSLSVIKRRYFWLDYIGNDMILKKFITSIRKTFPNASEFGIDGFVFSPGESNAKLANLLDEAGAKRILIRTSHPNDTLRHLKPLKNTQALILTQTKGSSTFMDFSLALAKALNVRELWLRDATLSDSKESQELLRTHLNAAGGQAKLTQLRLSKCQPYRQKPIKIDIPFNNFQNLKRILVEDCPGFEFPASPHKIEKWIRSQDQQGLLEIAQSITSNSQPPTANE